MTKITISYHLVASPGAEADVSIYTVPPARELVIKRVQVYFPAGTYGELRLHLKYGVMKVYPESSVITGDNYTHEKEAKLKYFSGDNVVVHYENTNTVEERQAFIDLEGELS